MNFNLHLALIVISPFLTIPTIAHTSSAFIPFTDGEHCEIESAEFSLPGGRLLHIAERCAEALDWFTPQDEGLSNDLEDRYQRNFSGEKRTFLLGNQQFQGTPLEWDYFMKLIAQEKEKEYQVPEHIYKSLAEGDCATPVTILCGLSHLYGQTDNPPDSPEGRREAAMRSMNVAKEFGLLITPRSYKRVRNFEKVLRADPPQWSLNSVRQIDSVLQSLPSSFHHMDTTKYFYRTMSGDQDMMSMRTNAWTWTGEPPEIVLKQSTFNEIKWSSNENAVGVHRGDKKNGSCTIAHELAHAFEFNHPEKVEKLGLWRSNFNRFGFRTNSTHNPTYPGMEGLSDYAFTNRHEYFAVAIDKFLCAPKEMKKKAPELFHVLKKEIFENKDFLGEDILKKEYKKKIRHERRLMDSPFNLDFLGKNILTKCLGGNHFQAKYKIDPETGRPLVYYYRPGFIRDQSGIRRALIGRTSSHDFFQTCFRREGIKEAQKIVENFTDCHPPDMKGMEEILREKAMSLLRNYDEMIIKKLQ